MKKILLAFDGTHFSEGAFEFVRRLNERQPVLLVGAFLPQTEFATLWNYTDGVGGVFIPMSEDGESEAIQGNIEKFEKLCRSNAIDYRVHTNFIDFAFPELKKESVFADLLILGSEVFYANKEKTWPGESLEDALHDMCCPVLLVPEKYEFPKSIILAYDGTEDAVYAIKQFAYLFPELSDMETLLVYAKDDENADFPDKIQMEELLARHFGNLTLFKLGVDARKYFKAWLADKTSAVLISGAYGRSGLSLMFKHSFVRDIIADHQLPVFIAHK